MTKEELEQIKIKNAYLPSTVEVKDHYSVVALIQALEQAWTERDRLLESLEWARRYDPFSSRACPLCLYAHGEILKVCSLHAEIAALNAELQAWRDGGLTEEILRNGDGYIKVGRGCLIISAHYLDEKDAEIAALKAKVRAKAAESDVVMVGSTLCPLEDVEDFLVRASNRLDDGRVGGDRLAPLDLAIDNALRLVQACLRE